MSEADKIYRHILPTADEEIRIYRNHIACEYEKKQTIQEMNNRKKAFFDLLLREVLRNKHDRHN